MKAYPERKLALISDRRIQQDRYRIEKGHALFLKFAVIH
jgi:hypothetical protein